MDALVSDLESKLASARMGGGEKARARMKEKGKLLPRERWEPYFLRKRFVLNERGFVGSQSCSTHIRHLSNFHH